MGAALAATGNASIRRAKAPTIMFLIFFMASPLISVVRRGAQSVTASSNKSRLANERVNQPTKSQI